MPKEKKRVLYSPESIHCTDLRNRWPLVVGQGGKRHNYTYYFGKVYMPLEGGADPGIAVCLLYNWDAYDCAVADSEPSSISKGC